MPKQEPEPASLDNLLHLFRGCNATDPRDKIFSVLGILEQSGAPALDIPRDYTIAIPSLYRITVESIIRSTNSLDILSQVQDPSQTQLKDLPSWVPDFSFGLMPTLIGAPRQALFAAVGAGDNPCYSFGKSDAELYVKGQRLDTVESVSEMGGCYFVRTGLLVAGLPEHYHPGRPATPDAETRIEAYWRTLVADSYNGITQRQCSAASTLPTGWLRNCSGPQTSTAWGSSRPLW
jgi:hypothetical protein